MNENKQKRGIASRIGIICLLLVVTFLLVYLATVLLSSSTFFKESAEKNATLYLEEDVNRANALAEHHFANLEEIADIAKSLDTTEQFEILMESYIGSEKFGDLRYYSNGKSYAANGALVVEETSGQEYIDPHFL